LLHARSAQPAEKDLHALQLGSFDLSARQRQIIDILTQAEELSLGNIKAGMADVPSQRTLQADMQYLKQRGVISSRGKGKATCWFLIKK
jgi:hypothetical protein